MTPDIDKYRALADRFDLSEDQKTELILTVWRVMEGFAFRAFGLDPVQQATASEKHARPGAPMLDFEKVSDPKSPLTATLQLMARKRNSRTKRQP